MLRQIGLTFKVIPSHIDEPPPQPGEDLAAWTMKIAEDKALAVLSANSEGRALVIGADTVVVLPVPAENGPLLHGRVVGVLGKPADKQDAHRMLRSLSNRTHSVISAFCLVCHPEGIVIRDALVTRVRFHRLSNQEIDDYIATGEPLDKAGAYGIQGLGATLVEKITGDFYTVVGLPLSKLWLRLQELDRYI